MRLGELIYWLMPDPMVWPAALGMFIVGIFLWLIGLSGLGRLLVFGAAGLVVLPPLIEPILDEILTLIPTWMVVLVGFALTMYFVRLVLTVFLGKEGAGEFLGSLAASGARRLFAIPFRLVGKGVPAMVRGALGIWRTHGALGLVAAALIGLAAAGVGYWVAAFWDGVTVQESRTPVSERAENSRILRLLQNL